MASKKHTKKPTGLSVKRSGKSIVISWTRGETYNGQELRYQFTAGGSTTVLSTKNRRLGAAAKSVSVVIPSKAGKITVKIKGHTKKRGWSTWTTKTFNITAPPKPSLSASWSEDYENRTVFTWSVNTSSDSPAVFTKIIYETILVKNYNGNVNSYVRNGRLRTSGTGISGYHASESASATGTISASWTTEDTSLLATGSYTRIVRARSHGPAYGAHPTQKMLSDAWVATTHTYAAPNAPVIDAEKTKATGNTATVVWTVQKGSSRPSDRQEVQYLTGEPAAGMVCPGGSWETAAKLTGEASGKAVFTLPTIPNDQAVWTRVVSYHDTHEIGSEPFLLKVGALTKPTEFTVTMPGSLSPGDTYTARFAATNNSGIDDSFLVVVKQTTKDEKPVAIIPHGEESATAELTYDGGKFAVYAAVGSYTEALAVQAQMTSEKVWYSAPVAPEITVSPTDTAGTAAVTWEWQTGVDAVELSWSDFAGAWTGTDEPEKAEIDIIAFPQWYINNLETGKIWYIKARFKIGNSYGVYSETQTINLTSAPAVPVLAFNPPVITQTGKTLARWGYISTDGTGQIKAQIIDSEDEVVAEVTGDSQQITLEAADFEAGSHELRLIVTSASGHESDPSEPQPLVIADPLTVEITNTNLREIDGPAAYVSTSGGKISVLVEDPQELAEYLVGLENMAYPEYPVRVEVVSGSAGTLRISSTRNYGAVVYLSSLPGASITYSGWNEEDYNAGKFTAIINSTPVKYYELATMPLTFDVSANCIIQLQRAEDFFQIRPDEKEADGFEGEVVYTQYIEEPGSVSIYASDLTGYLDDRCSYKITADAQDELGQHAHAEIPFRVNWDEQATMPSGTVEYEAPVGKIFIDAMPSDTGTYEIYRLSQDPPQLIYSNAIPGVAYADPYPASHGGYRIVRYTDTHDYITQNNIPAFYDEYMGLDLPTAIIDFNGWRLELPYDLKFDHKWQKDFEATKYLGGAIQGDWNPAVSRSGSLSTRLTTANQETIDGLRRLAVWPGLCHLRTPEGSSIACNIDVSESRDVDGKICSFALDVERIDPEGFEALRYTDWKDE